MAPRQINEADWKLYRPLHAVALQRFCELVLDEVGELAEDEKKTAHERYLAIYECMRRRDHELGELFDDFRRSTAWVQLARMRQHNLVTDEEFAQFSAETRAVVQLYLGDE